MLLTRHARGERPVPTAEPQGGRVGRPSRAGGSPCDLPNPTNEISALANKVPRAEKPKQIGTSSFPPVSPPDHRALRVGGSCCPRCAHGSGVQIGLSRYAGSVMDCVSLFRSSLGTRLAKRTERNGTTSPSLSPSTRRAWCVGAACELQARPSHSGASPIVWATAASAGVPDRRRE